MRRRRRDREEEEDERKETAGGPTWKEDILPGDLNHFEPPPLSPPKSTQVDLGGGMFKAIGVKLVGEVPEGLRSL